MPGFRIEADSLGELQVPVPSRYDTVILENDAVVALAERRCHRPSQRLASRRLVGGKPNFSAHVPGLVKQARVWHLVD